MDEARTARITDAWYPDPSAYWVPESAVDERPYRYGDLFAAPAEDAARTRLTDTAGEPWFAVMPLSPSCELVSKAKPGDLIEVARVYPLAAQDAKAQAAIVTGWQERDGRVTIAFAHTVFLAPVPGHETHNVPMFAHLKTTTRVRFGDLVAAGRIAALDHDARVHVIRREIYYRYRWLTDFADVHALERDRISHDPVFTPPRPEWGAWAGDEPHP